MAQGQIVQCIGAVVDIQFPRDQMPKVYDALRLQDSGSSLAEAGLTFAEMPHSQKAELGHRGRAFAALKPQLRELLNQDKQ